MRRSRVRRRIVQTLEEQPQRHAGRAGQVAELWAAAVPVLRSGQRRPEVALDLERSRRTPTICAGRTASLARLAGADLRFIQKAMGHESITTTARIYAHLYDDELDAIAEAMSALRAPQGGPK